MKRIFVSSLRALHSPRALAYAAVLVAAQVVLAMQVTLSLTDSLHITFDRSVLALNASLLGPVPGMLAGAVSDLLQCLLHGWTPNPGLTLNEVLAGLTYGLLLCARPAPCLPGKACGLRECLRRVWPLLLAQAVVCVLLNILLGTLWLCLMYGWPYFATLPARALKNLAQFPADVLLIWLLLALRDRLYASGAVKPLF